jgi:predicted XRE-type DNA-binding protein
MNPEERYHWVELLEEADAKVQAAEAYRLECQEELYRLVREAVAAGMQQGDIGVALGVTRQRVSQIVLMTSKESEET